MKRTLFGLSLFSLTLTAGAFAQSGQSPVMQQSTSTTDNRQANPPRPKVKKGSVRDLGAGLDSLSPKNRKQRRLRPDSLRRGGATRVDTVR